MKIEFKSYEMPYNTNPFDPVSPLAGEGEMLTAALLTSKKTNEGNLCITNSVYLQLNGTFIVHTTLTGQGQYRIMYRTGSCDTLLLALAHCSFQNIGQVYDSIVERTGKEVQEMARLEREKRDKTIEQRKEQTL